MVTRHPAFRPAIAMTLGIVLTGYVGVDWRIGFAAAAAVGLAGLFWKKQRALLIPGVWLLFGASLLSWRMDARQPNDLRNLLGIEPELVTVRGVLAEDPERRVLEQDRRTRFRTTARVAVNEIQRRSSTNAATGFVAISTTGFLPDEYVAGAAVEISGVIAPPRGRIAPGLFDFEEYLKWQRVFHVLRADSTNDWKVLTPVAGWTEAKLYRTFNDWARRTLQRGIPNDENTRLLFAMVVGWRPGLTYEVSEPFMRTGTLHIFAISGLHIAMIAALLIAALRFIHVPRTWAGCIAIPIIWFYTGATGWQASAIRSTIMSSVIIVGWLLKRPNNLLNSLAVSAILILCWQPEQLFQPGFQLSFLLLLSMALWPGLSPNTPWPDPYVHLSITQPGDFERRPNVNAWTRGMARLYVWMTGRDPMLPEELRPKWRRRSDTAAVFLLNSINISLASFVGSLPVIALDFNMISFSSIIANLVIVPVSGITLTAALTSLVLAPFPYLPEVANWVAWGTMKFMVWFCRELESFRWTYNYVQSPGALLIAAYYVTIVTLLRGWLRKPLVTVAVTALCALAVGLACWRETTTTRVTTLPGSGVVFIDAPGTKSDLLVDCGREREAEMVVRRFLHSQGVDTLHAILLTHGDVAHVEGYARLASEFQPTTTYTSAAKSRSPKYRAIIKGLEQNPERWRKVAADDEIAGWKVLHPAAGEDFGRADDEAVVLRKIVGEVSITLLSELGRNGQQKLIERSGNLPSDFVVGGCPSGGEIAQPALVEKLGPKVFVLTGNDAKAQRAARDLRGRGIKTIPTADEHAVMITIKNGRASVETAAHGKLFP